MECHLLRGIQRLHCAQLRTRRLGFNVASISQAIGGSFQASDKRLYHHTGLRSPAIQFLSSPVLSKKSPVFIQPQQTRTIIISKVISVLQEADLTSIAGVSNFILESSLVATVKSFYALPEAATGLPWAANILMCSFVLQLVFNVPANVYLGRWMTGKEKHTADMIAIRSSVMRAPDRASVQMFGRMHNDLTKQYGCERYKFFGTLLYQIVHVTTTSFAIRALLLDSNTDVQNALLPWGAMLGQPEFILPVVNVALNLLLVEVGAWKKARSEDGLKMTFKRAGIPFQSEPLYLLNLRRFCCVPMILIYAVVPSAMTLHWFVLVATSANMQILLTHKQTRRTLGIPSGYYESDNPYRDFLNHLKNDVKITRKKD